jgi:hypothetical protein
MDLAEKSKPFWESVDRTNAVRLHKEINYGDGPRHHAVYIDCAALILDDRFRALAIQCLDSVEFPDLVIVPKHGNSQRIRDLVEEGYSKRLLKPDIHIASLNELPGLLSRYSGCSKVLVADDGVVTGRTIISYKIEIYRFFQEIDRTISLSVFCLLFRPTSKGFERQLKLPFYGDKGKRNFHYVQLIFLPSGLQCPWCEEQRLLVNLKSKVRGNGRAFLEERVLELERRHSKWLLADVTGPQTTKTLRTFGSYFGTLKTDTAVAATFSASYEMALDIEVETDPFHRRIVDLPGIIDAYFETPLIAGMLRAFRRRNLRAEDKERVLSETITNYPDLHAYPGTVGELAWAAVVQKLPKEPILQLLSKMSREDGMVDMMIQLLQQ